MRFIEHSALSRLNVLLKDLDVGDRLLNCRLELFDFDTLVSSPSVDRLNELIEIEGQRRRRRSSAAEAALSLAAHPSGREYKAASRNNALSGGPSAIEPSAGNEIAGLSDRDQPLDEGGRQRAVTESTLTPELSKDALDLTPKRKEAEAPLALQESRSLLVALLRTMNACFPDYDFSSLSPDMFVHMENFVEVFGNINYHLSFVVERAIPGFLQDLWSAIRDAVGIRHSEIYSYKPTGEAESDPFHEAGCLFSFDYFFVDKSQNRILFFSCTTNSKVVSPGTGNTHRPFNEEWDSDEEMSGSEGKEDCKSLSSDGLSMASSEASFVGDDSEQDDGDLMLGEIRC